MKTLKLFILLFLGLIVVSFSKKNNQKSSVDPIIGTWKLEKIVYKYSDGKSKEETIVKCSNSKTYTYNSDGTLFFQSYYLDNTTNECTVKGNDYWIGTWQNDSNGVYIRNLVSKYNDEIRSQYKDSTDVFVFTKSNNTLEKITNYEKAGIVFEDSSKRISEHAFFQRINQ